MMETKKSVIQTQLLREGFALITADERAGTMLVREAQQLGDYLKDRKAYDSMASCRFVSVFEENS